MTELSKCLKCLNDYYIFPTNCLDLCRDCQNKQEQEDQENYYENL